MPLEIQNMIMKHLNANSIHGKWIEWKLYNNDDIVNAVSPFFHIVRNNVVLSCREDLCCSVENRLDKEFLRIVGQPWIVTNSPPSFEYLEDDDYH